MKCYLAALGLTLSLSTAFAQKSAAPAPKQDPDLVVNPEFEAVAQRLDRNGTEFFYKDYSTVVEDLGKFGDDIEARLGPDSPVKDIAGKIMKSARVLGVDQIKDLGISAAKRKDGRGQRKTLLRVKSPTGIFFVDDSSRKPLELASYIPPTAGLVTDVRWSPKALWDLGLKVAAIWAKSDDMLQFEETLANLKKNNGLDIRALVDSLGNEMAFAATVGEKKSPDALPRVGAILMAELKTNDTFKTIERTAQAAGILSKPGSSPEGWSVLRFELPPALPDAIKPVIASNGKLLLLAVHEKDFSDALAAKASGKSFRETAEFQSVGAGLPQQYHGLSYCSKSIVEAATAYGNYSVSELDNAELKVTVSAALKQLSRLQGALAVTVYENDGFLVLERSANSAGFFGDTRPDTATMVAIGGIGVAIAIPAFLRAQENSRAQACQENLSKIDGAKEQYALEFRLSNRSPVTMTNLITPPGAAVGHGYLRNTPHCPSGGSYSVNTIGEPPTCSLGERDPKHKLP